VRARLTRPAVWEGPGFVDHHAHLLVARARTRDRFGEPGDVESVAARHRDLAARGLSPTDEEPVQPEATDLGTVFAGALAEAAALGLTEITEASMGNPAHLDALLRLREHGPLPLRVKVPVSSGLAEREGVRRTGDPWVEVIGVKFYADGWLRPRTCALCAPFADGPRDRGILFLESEALALRAAPFAEQGWQIATHAIGDRAIEAVLDAYERIWGSDCRVTAPRIEHAQVLAPDLIARMAAMGVVACIQPGFAQADSQDALEALGERARDAYSWDALLAAGVRVISGSDYPIEALSPLDGVRRLVAGAPVSAPLPIDTALSLMTDASAGVVSLSADPRLAPLGEIEVLGARPTGAGPAAP
jgi:predicted amidohydrolase YtcJ